MHRKPLESCSWEQLGLSYPGFGMGQVDAHVGGNQEWKEMLLLTLCTPTLTSVGCAHRSAGLDSIDVAAPSQAGFGRCVGNRRSVGCWAVTCG